MKTERWQDWLNLLLGAWLAASPWALGYADEHRHMAWSAWLAGGAVIVLAGTAVTMPKAWEEAVNFLLGAWVMASPWVLDAASNRTVTGNALIVGALVMLFAIWAMARDPDVRKRVHLDNKAG